MIGSVLVVIQIFSLAITVFLGVFTLTKCNSRKKSFFILTITAVFLFALGYLLELTATSDDGGFTATKVLYLGSAFISPLYMLFIVDYCEIKFPPRYAVISVFAIPVLVIFLLWTTQAHGLIYTGFYLDATPPVSHLVITPGRLYWINHVYAFVCMLLTICLLLSRVAKWGREYWPQLALLLLGAITPSIANLLFVLKLNAFGINYTPVSLVAMNVFLYFSIVRYDIFDIIPKASEAALDGIKEGFILVDRNMHLLSANPAAQAIFPELKPNKKGLKINTLPFWPAELSTLNEKRGNENIQFSLSNQQARHYSASITAVYKKSDEIAGWVMLLSDITNTVDLLKQLEEAAYTDALTGIYNRRHFMELARMHFDRTVRERKPLYAIMIDLDYFKNVNDTYGHQSGDEVLRTCAQIIKGIMRPYDLFARYGGEEFIVLLTDIDKANAAKLAERMRQKIMKAAVAHTRGDIRITASFGLAARADEDELMDVIKKADDALYRAKDMGRNRVEFF